MYHSMTKSLIEIIHILLSMSLTFFLNNASPYIHLSFFIIYIGSIIAMRIQQVKQGYACNAYDYANHDQTSIYVEFIMTNMWIHHKLFGIHDSCHINIKCNYHDFNIFIKLVSESGTLSPVPQDVLRAAPRGLRNQQHWSTARAMMVCG